MRTNFVQCKPEGVFKVHKSYLIVWTYLGKNRTWCLFLIVKSFAGWTIFWADSLTTNRAAFVGIRYPAGYPVLGLLSSFVCRISGRPTGYSISFAGYPLGQPDIRFHLPDIWKAHRIYGFICRISCKPTVYQVSIAGYHIGRPDIRFHLPDIQ